MFVWINVKNMKNVSCWFAFKANNDFAVKLFAVMTCWACWHLLMIFCWLVLTPQYHMKVSFCNLPSFCTQCRGVNDWKRRWKVGHSCSLYFPNIPPSAWSTPASLCNSTSSATPSYWHTLKHMHTQFSVCCVPDVTFHEGKKEGEKKQASQSRKHVPARVKGIRKRRRSTGSSASLSAVLGSSVTTWCNQILQQGK